MLNTTIKILFGSLHVDSSNTEPPFVAELITSHEAVLSAIHTLIDSGEITAEDLTAILISQVNNCDSISIDHVLPREKLDSLVKAYNSISLDTI